MRFAVVLLGLVIAAPVGAVTLTFDDLQGSSQIETYNGYDFGNFYAFDTLGGVASGYDNSVVSLNNVAYNGDGGAASIKSATPFNLTSGYLAAAWNDGLTVKLVGSLAGTQVFTQSFVVTTAHSVFEAFNPALIDTVVFSTSGGILNPSFYTTGHGSQLSLDNLTINGTLPPPPPPAVPEPAAWLMMVAGFGLIGTALRRPARAQTA